MINIKTALPKTVLRLACAALLLTAGATFAAEIKIGLLGQYSGTYAWYGQEFDRGVDLFMQETGGKVGNHTLTIIRRDEGGTNAARARQLAQELVLRNQVQYLIGGAFTPTIMGTADIVTQTKTPYFMGNTGTSSVTDKSPYFVRMGFTQWQLSVPLTQWAWAQGAREAVIVAADFAPGVDAIEAFTHGFTEAGGRITEVIRVPLGTADFSTYLQRVQGVANSTASKHVFMFMPSGPMSVSFIKAFYERGLHRQGIQLMATNETMEFDLPAIGQAALGMVTAQHYSPFLDTKVNQDFVQRYQARYGSNALPTFASLAVYDGMQMIARLVRELDGKRDGDKAMTLLKDYTWDSPRGPVKLDAQTRELVQNVYMRRIEKIHAGTTQEQLGNVPFQTFTAMPDFWHVRQRQPGQR